MAGVGKVTALHVVELTLVIRHLMGCAESAQDRIGARHRRITQLYCIGWCDGRPFACLIRDPEHDPVTRQFGNDSHWLSPDELRTVRLKAMRQAPTAIWHHPYPLETSTDYATQEATLIRHLANHADEAGWTGAVPDERAQPPSAAANPPVRGPLRQTDFCPRPPVLEETAAQPVWAPDPDAPPSHIRVFPGWIDYRGQRYAVTGREGADPASDRLAMEYRAQGGAATRSLWLNDTGRILTTAHPRHR